MPQSFFILSKENLELATDEVIAIAKSYDKYAKFDSYSNLLLIQSKTPWYKIAQRATFVKTAGQIIEKMSNLFLQNSSVLKNSKTIACKIINLSSKKINTTEIVRVMGNMFTKFCKVRVSLADPDLTIYLVCTNFLSFLGFSTRIKKVSRPKKVVKCPVELDWKLSRVMINLAGLKENDVVCDPFCGTGTTLLEAESMGIHAIGIDFDKKMCEITKKNLAANGFNSQVINANFSSILKIKDKIDGIVTDLPYGMASKSSESPDKLIQKFVRIIPRDKKIAIMCKKGFENKIKLKPTKKYELYRHKSLSRTIMVK